MDFILKKKLKFYTKEFLKFFNIIVIAFGFIIAIVFIKYKPMYKVSISGEEIGYVENKQALEETLKEEITENTSKTVEDIQLNDEPEYELKLVNRAEDTEDKTLVEELKEEVTVTYKYYEIAVQETVVEKVDTSEEAEELINEIKEQNNSEDIDLSIVEKYTQNEEEANTSDLEVAKVNVQETVQTAIEEIEQQKEEEERWNALPSINGIKLAVTPIEGRITSRYGVRSSIRKSTHTGLDISAVQGTAIKVIADGTVTAASYNGSYGNLVKVDHGNGVETWYAHTSKMYVKKGDTVKAGDVIAAVGSTGNSTGPHLHLEIRVNGEHVDPQDYLYK